MNNQKIYDSLSRQGATSLMNNWKWSRLFYVLGTLPVCYRVKLVDKTEASEWQLSNNYAQGIPESEVYFTQIGSVPFLSIHWLEVRPLNDDVNGSIAAQIEGISNRLSRARTRDGSTVRFWGHVLQSDIVPPDEENS